METLIISYLLTRSKRVFVVSAIVNENACPLLTRCLAQWFRKCGSRPILGRLKLQVVAKLGFCLKY